MSKQSRIDRPVFRAPGGKFRMAKWIVSHFPSRGQYDFYIEPYCFAASVFLHSPKVKAEIINDMNDQVTDTFMVLRDPVLSEKLREQLLLTPLSYTEYQRSYQYPPTDDPVEKARRLIFQSFATIGTDGIVREKSGFRGLKNNESGITAALDWSTYPDAIPGFRRRLQGVLIENRPALKVIDVYDTERSLFYLDPPYPLGTRSRSRPYYKFEMTDNDHVELLKKVRTLKGMSLISSYDNEIYRDMLCDWRMDVFDARVQGNAPRKECLWISPNLDAHVQSSFL